MNVFIERYLLPLLVLVSGANAVTNPMGFSATVRVLVVVIATILAVVVALYSKRRRKMIEEQFAAVPL
jgi:positive regulator of sigma E activity